MMLGVGDGHHCPHLRQIGYALATLAVARSVVEQGRANLVACQPNLEEGDYLMVERLEVVLASLEGMDQAGTVAGILDRHLALQHGLAVGIVHASHTIHMGAVLAKVDAGAGHFLDPAMEVGAPRPAAAAAAAAHAVGTVQR